MSSSVDAGEDALQRSGLAAAMDAPEVRRAFLDHGSVALGAFEWSGKWQQDWILRWRMIETEADLGRAIAEVGGSVRVENRYPTALGYALAFAKRSFRFAPDCDLQVVDVSGDGINNDGFGPRLTYENFPFGEITVNGLVISGDVDVIDYYRREVIRGPFAFVETTRDYRGFRDAMQRKLRRELEPRVIGALR